MDKSFSLTDLFKSRINLVNLISYETLIVRSLVFSASQRLNYTWYKWNGIEGVEKFNIENHTFENVDEVDPTTGRRLMGLNVPTEALDWYSRIELDDKGEDKTDLDKSIILFEDFDLFAYPNKQENPIFTTALKNFYEKPDFKDSRFIVISSCYRNIPTSLSKICYQHEVAMPDESDLTQVFKSVCNNRSLDIDEVMDSPVVVDIIRGSKGFSTYEAGNIFNKIITANEGKPVNSKKYFTAENVHQIIKEKEQVIKNSGVLEFYPLEKKMDDVGGMDVLKKWMYLRKNAFLPEAKEFGLPVPKGAVLLGLPGTGKSLVAKAVASIFEFPLVRMDIGKVYAGLVGESESNMRHALQIINALSPVVVWIDEIEKGLSGMKSSNRTDGGTTSRVLGTFLTWMQERTEPVFIIATANQVESLPPELLRKGRFDEIFFVDLPTKSEREEIIKIHLKKFNRNPDGFDVVKIAEESRFFSGSELEEAIKEALFIAFDDKKKDLTTEHILGVIEKTYPLAITMREELSRIKTIARDRAVRASSVVNDEIIPTTQEEINSFRKIKADKKESKKGSYDYKLMSDLIKGGM